MEHIYVKTQICADDMINENAWNFSTSPLFLNFIQHLKIIINIWMIWFLLVVPIGIKNYMEHHLEVNTSLIGWI